MRASLITIHVSQHDVQSPDDRHHVRHQRSLDHVGQSLEIHERGRAEPHAIGLVFPLAYDVKAQLAAGTLHRVIDLPYRGFDAFGHLAHHLARGQSVQGLLDDSQALAHLPILTR
jgi:hypothetical protein